MRVAAAATRNTTATTPTSSSVPAWKQRLSFSKSAGGSGAGAPSVPARKDKLRRSGSTDSANSSNSNTPSWKSKLGRKKSFNSSNSNNSSNSINTPSWKTRQSAAAISSRGNHSTNSSTTPSWKTGATPANKPGSSSSSWKSKWKNKENNNSKTNISQSDHNKSSSSTSSWKFRQSAAAISNNSSSGGTTPWKRSKRPATATATPSTTKTTTPSRKSKSAAFVPNATTPPSSSSNTKSINQQSKIETPENDASSSSSVTEPPPGPAWKANNKLKRGSVPVAAIKTPSSKESTPTITNVVPAWKARLRKSMVVAPPPLTASSPTQSETQSPEKESTRIPADDPNVKQQQKQIDETDPVKKGGKSEDLDDTQHTAEETEEGEGSDESVEDDDSDGSDSSTDSDAVVDGGQQQDEDVLLNQNELDMEKRITAFQQVSDKVLYGIDSSSSAAGNNSQQQQQQQQQSEAVPASTKEDTKEEEDKMVEFDAAAFEVERLKVQEQLAAIEDDLDNAVEEIQEEEETWRAVTKTQAPAALEEPKVDYQKMLEKTTRRKTLLLQEKGTTVANDEMELMMLDNALEGDNGDDDKKASSIIDGRDIVKLEEEAQPEVFCVKLDDVDQMTMSAQNMNLGNLVLDSGKDNKGDPELPIQSWMMEVNQDEAPDVDYAALLNKLGEANEDNEDTKVEKLDIVIPTFDAAKSNLEAVKMAKLADEFVKDINETEDHLQKTNEDFFNQAIYSAEEDARYKQCIKKTVNQSEDRDKVAGESCSASNQEDKDMKVMQLDIVHPTFDAAKSQLEAEEMAKLADEFIKEIDETQEELQKTDEDFAHRATYCAKEDCRLKLCLQERSNQSCLNEDKGVSSSCSVSNMEKEDMNAKQLDIAQPTSDAAKSTIEAEEMAKLADEFVKTIDETKEDLQKTDEDFAFKAAYCALEKSRHKLNVKEQLNQASKVEDQGAAGPCNMQEECKLGEEEQSGSKDPEESKEQQESIPRLAVSATRDTKDEDLSTKGEPPPPVTQMPCQGRVHTSDKTASRGTGAVDQGFQGDTGKGYDSSASESHTSRNVESNAGICETSYPPGTSKLRLGYSQDETTEPQQGGKGGFMENKDLNNADDHEGSHSGLAAGEGKGKSAEAAASASLCATDACDQEALQQEKMDIKRTKSTSGKKLDSERVYEDQIEADKAITEVERLKAAKLAKKARKQRRRATCTGLAGIGQDSGGRGKAKKEKRRTSCINLPGKEQATSGPVNSNGPTTSKLIPNERGCDSTVPLPPHRATERQQRVQNTDGVASLVGTTRGGPLEPNEKLTNSVDPLVDDEPALQLKLQTQNVKKEMSAEESKLPSKEKDLKDVESGDDSTAEESVFCKDVADGSATRPERHQDMSPEQTHGHIHQNIRFQKSIGSITVTQTELCYQEYDQPDSGALHVPWSLVAKQQASPPSYPKVLLKLILSAGKPLTFQFQDRKALECLRDDIATIQQRALKLAEEQSERANLVVSNQNNPNTTSVQGMHDDADPQNINAIAGSSSASTGSKKDEDASCSASPFDPVQFRDTTGSLTLEADQLVFKPEESRLIEQSWTKVSWDQVSKHQTSPPKASKAMMKLLLKSGKSLTFTLKDHVGLLQLGGEIAKHLKNRKSSLGAKEIPQNNVGSSRRIAAAGPSNARLPNNACRRNTFNADMTVLADHPRVVCQGANGSISMTGSHMRFKTTKDLKSTKPVMIAWREVHKFQASPPKHPNALLKLTLKTGKSFTFELENRSALRKIRDDVAFHWNRQKTSRSSEQAPSMLGNASSPLDLAEIAQKGEAETNSHDGNESHKKTVTSNSSETSERNVHKDVEFRKRNGIVTLTASELCHQADGQPESKSLHCAWHQVKKQQTSPPSHPKALLKVVLISGEALTFQLKTRGALERLKDDIAGHITASKSKKNDSNIADAGTVVELSDICGHNDSQPAPDGQNCGQGAPLVFEPAKLNRVQGSLLLDGESISFQPKKRGSTRRSFPWTSVNKHVTNAPTSSQALLKLTLEDGSTETIQVKNRDCLRSLRNSISGHIPSHPKVVSNDPAVGGCSLIANVTEEVHGEPSEVSKGETSIPTRDSDLVFEPVKFNKVQGCLVVNGDSLSFQPKKTGSTKKSIPWSAVQKHVTNAPTSSQALLKLTLEDGSTETIQVKNRDSLRSLRNSITGQLSNSKAKNPSNGTAVCASSQAKESTNVGKSGITASSANKSTEQDTSTPGAGKTATPGSNSPLIFDPVKFNKEQGALVLNGESLTFQPKKRGSTSRSIPWSHVEKHATNGPNSSQALIKLTLENGTSETIQLKDRHSLKSLRNSIAEHLPTSQMKKTDSSTVSADRTLARESGSVGHTQGAGSSADQGEQDVEPRDSQSDDSREGTSQVFEPVKWNKVQGSLFLNQDSLSFQPKKGTGTGRTIPWTAVQEHTTNASNSSQALLKLTLDDGTNHSIQLKTRDSLNSLRNSLSGHISSSQSKDDSDDTVGATSASGTKNYAASSNLKNEPLAMKAGKGCQPEPTSSDKLKSAAKVSTALLKFQQAKALSDSASQFARAKQDTQDKLLGELHADKSMDDLLEGASIRSSRSILVASGSSHNRSTVSSSISSQKDAPIKPNDQDCDSDVDSEVDVDDVHDDDDTISDVATDSDGGEDPILLEPAKIASIPATVFGDAGHDRNDRDSDVEDHSDVDLDSDDELDSDGEY